MIGPTVDYIQSDPFTEIIFPPYGQMVPRRTKRVLQKSPATPDSSFGWLRVAGRPTSVLTALRSTPQNQVWST